MHFRSFNVKSLQNNERSTDEIMILNVRESEEVRHRYEDATPTWKFKFYIQYVWNMSVMNFSVLLSTWPIVCEVL